MKSKPMKSKKRFTLQCFPVLGIFLLSATLVICIGFFSCAQAVSAPIDGSCSKLDKYGFTEGLVYCVQASVGDAVATYVPVMQTQLHPYELAALAVAIALFGIKLMNSAVQEPVKEVAIIIFRVLIGVFFYTHGVFIYNHLAGTLPNNDGIINQAIGWVTGLGASGGSLGSGNNVFANIISTKCTVPTAYPGGTTGYEGYQIWQAFDCMFSTVLGAANPGDHPYAFATSLLVIVGAALFSGTLGVITSGLAISLILGVLLFIMRALFLVLMSYVCIGFMAIFAPLMSPLIFFESKYLTEKFKQWLGIIVSAIFQPVFVIGFLGLAISVDDQLIEGNIPGCHPPTYPSGGSVMDAAPPAGFGQDGSGVCSFTQLVYNNQSGSVLQNAFYNFMEQNASLFNMAVAGDSQGHQNGGGFYDNLTGNTANPEFGMNNSVTNGINQASQLTTQTGNFGANVTRLKNFFPMKQLLLTMLTFIFVNYAIKGLMETIPQIASNMTISVGVNLMQQLQVPFEGGVSDFLSGANSSMMQAAQGKGLLSGNFGGVGGLAKGLEDGALAGVRNVIKNN